MGKFRILFMGTPDFAEAALEALIRHGETVVGAVCREDKPVGRKQVMTAPPVKVCAMRHGIPVYQPTTLKNESFLPVLNALQPDMIIVVAYGKILPNYILDFPAYGCFNVHASLLPKLRGASPIQWSIVSGETETGITLMKMNSGMDEGDIVLQTKTDILPTDTGESLWDRLAAMGAETLLLGLERFEAGDFSSLAQDHEKATYAPMLNSSTGKIDWNQNMEVICRTVRGLNPWPAAYSIWENKRLKIMEAIPAEGTGSTGEVIAADKKTGLLVACKDGAVRLLRIRPEGSREMTDIEFVCGHPNLTGTVLG